MTNWMELEQKYYFHIINRMPLVIVRGQDSRVWDEDGKQYLDFVAGWAVLTLGHCSPIVVEALKEQAEKLILCSNQFYNIPQLELVQMLVENSCLDKAFLSNSGAEANEGAIKLARKYGKVHLNGAYEVITTLKSFHGRTLAMVAATGKPAYQESFKPLPAGFINVEYNNIEALKTATTDRTCAIMLEPVQGEGGVNVPDLDYLKQVRAWCDERGILLIFDEVQTGVGRLGTLWGYQQFGVEPDIMTVAKGLGSGVPIGAFLGKEKTAVFTPGDHGSTYGGNALMSAVGKAVLSHVLEKDIPGHVAKIGAYMTSKLEELNAKDPRIIEVRGRGLLQAIEFDREMSDAVVRNCLSKGLLLNAVKPTAIRFMPPLTIGEAEVDEAIAILSRALDETTVEAPEAQTGP
ncbi:MAG: aspartate aminotransferase family protein [Chloroflexota bacterium]|nr:MAG: aspartate aminotransferase family protein [Chloroflexota bacterium]